ncbi:hypothetical protein [Pseudoalteromonas phage J2-1_QLiu-2017]|nr:hypothetical protein [Pseudoalteromonas phage J2-1_QLiu-2017]
MKTLFTIEFDGKPVEINYSNFWEYFDGECPEKDEAGRHFKGYCTVTFDLTKDKTAPPEMRGMWYLSGFWDGDWGVEFTDHEFVSNHDIKVSEVKAPAIMKVKVKGVDKLDLLEKIVDKVEEVVAQYTQQMSYEVALEFENTGE